MNNTNIFNDENSKLLITGGCGFIGSSFINYIFTKLNKIKIINIDCINYCANLNNIKNIVKIDPRYKFIPADLKNFDNIKYIINNELPTHIIHFAAQTHVDNSFYDSIAFTNDNILGTHNLLEISRHLTTLKLFIHVSTDEVYGESMISDQEQMKDEQSILCPTNPYAATKAGAELLAKSYFYTYKMPIIITRGNNVYGPNQYPEKLIPKFINHLLDDKKVTIHGKGDNLRAFLYVDDVVTAFECILSRGKIGEVYNIGCDENMEYSVIQITKILCKYLKPDDDFEKWIQFIPDRLFNDKRYYISNSKLKQLGWKINVKFDDGIQLLIESIIDKFINNKTD